MRTLIQHRMAETARMHEQQVGFRNGGFVRRLAGNRFTRAAGFDLFAVLLAKYMMSGLAPTPLRGAGIG